MKVVFVCLGNICRSPMAEAVFRHMVTQAGQQETIQIDSAATSSWEKGNPVHRGTRQKLSSVGISTSGMYSRQLTLADLEADYLIGMDDANIEAIQRFSKGKTRAKIVKLLSFAGEKRDIEDPWYTGDFEKTYQDVVIGCQGLLEEIQARLMEEGE